MNLNTAISGVARTSKTSIRQGARALHPNNASRREAKCRSLLVHGMHKDLGIRSVAGLLPNKMMASNEVLNQPHSAFSP